MAFGAFAGGFDEVRVGLVGLNTRTRTLNQKRAKIRAKAMANAIKTERKDINPPGLRSGTQLPRKGAY